MNIEKAFTAEGTEERRKISAGKVFSFLSFEPLLANYFSLFPSASSAVNSLTVSLS